MCGHSKTEGCIDKYFYMIFLVEMTKNDNLVNKHYQIRRYLESYCGNVPVERAVCSPVDKDSRLFLIIMQLQWIPRRTRWSQRLKHNQGPSLPQDGTKILNCQGAQLDLHIWQGKKKKFIPSILFTCGSFVAEHQHNTLTISSLVSQVSVIKELCHGF